MLFRSRTGNTYLYSVERNAKIIHFFVPFPEIFLKTASGIQRIYAKAISGKIADI